MKVVYHNTALPRIELTQGSSGGRISVIIGHILHIEPEDPGAGSCIQMINTFLHVRESYEDILTALDEAAINPEITKYLGVTPKTQGYRSSNITTVITAEGIAYQSCPNCGKTLVNAGELGDRCPEHWCINTIARS